MTEPYIGLLPSPLASLAPYIQDGIIGSMFYAALVTDQSMLRFFTEDADAVRLFPGKTGQTMFLTRDAEHNVDPNPSQPGVDPTASTHTGEQFRVQPQQYDAMIWLDQLVNFLAAGNRSQREIKNFIATNAAKKLDRVGARAAYGTYSGGHTNASAAGVATTALPVASINGFTETIDTNGQIQPVSVANPKWINIAGTMRQITAAVPTDAVNSPFGAGTLTLSAVHTWSQHDYVIASDAPMVLYAGGGNSVDAISAADTLALPQILNAVSELRNQGVPSYPDGLYRAFLSPAQENQLLNDPKIESLTAQRGLEMSVDPEVQKATIIIAGGVRFMRCNSVPDSDTAANMTNGLETGVRASAALSREIWAETRNKDGVEVKRLLIYGMGGGELHYVDTEMLVPESGMLSAIDSPAKYAVGSMGIMVWPQPWMRLLVGKPTDVHQLRVPFSFLSILDTVCPSDFRGGYTRNRDLSTVGGRNPRYKRAVTIIHS